MRGGLCRDPVGHGSNGRQRAPNFSMRYAPDATTTGEGSEALGFYNVFDFGRL